MAKAVAKFIRMSPRKLRRVINVVRGKDASSARTTLKFMPYAAARVVEKVLNSAVANAKENDKQNPDELKISKAYVDQSTTLRRWRAMSRGRGYPILKRVSHVTIEVEHDPNIVVKKPTGRFAKTVKSKEDKHVHDHSHEHKHEHGHEHKAEKPLKKSPKQATKATKEPVEPKEVKGTKEKSKDVKKKDKKKEEE